MKHLSIALLILTWGLGPRALAGGFGARLHPIDPPSAEEAWPILSLPQDQRDRVHVLLINGVDPGNLFNFQGIHGFVQELGFRNTSFFQLWEQGAVRDKIGVIRANDPQARIVVVGFSAGSQAALGAVQSVPGPPIDLLVYVAGNFAGIKATSRPAQALKLVDISSRGPVFGLLPFSFSIEGACKYDLGNIRHARVPMNRYFQQILVRELYEVTCGLPLPKVR
jgi:hypothetical protein